MATQFFHVGMIPLIPRGPAVFVTAGGGLLSDAWEGVALQTSWKSRVLAWGRGAAWAAFMTSLVLFDQAPALAPPVLITGLALWIALALPYRRASWTRACELADALGAAHEQRVKMALAYSKVDPDTARQALQRSEQEGVAADGIDEALRLLEIDAALELELAARQAEKQARIEREQSEREALRRKRVESTAFANALPCSNPKRVKFACPHCHKVSKVASTCAGRRGRCRHCSGALRVPPPAPVRPRRSARPNRRRRDDVFAISA